MSWRRAVLIAALPVSAVAGIHLALGTPPSPPHQYVLDRPVVAIVGGRAEHCLPRAWKDEAPHRVVNLARRDTDWHSVVAQVRFLLDVAPPAILVAAVDPEQMLYERQVRPDPDRIRRMAFSVGGWGARVYGVFDRWLSVPRLVEGGPNPRLDPDRWGEAMGSHWADPDGLSAVRRVLRDARRAGVDVRPVLLPLPEIARTAWRDADHGPELDRILESLGGVDLLEMEDAYFPDGIGCSRITGRMVLDQLALPGP